MRVRAREWRARGALCALVVLSLLAAGPGLGAPAQMTTAYNAATGRLQEAVAGQVIVRFARTDTMRAADATHQAAGAKLVGRIPQIGMDLVQCPPGMSIEDTSKLYRGRPGVAAASPNFVARAFGTWPSHIAAIVAGARPQAGLGARAVPNDPSWSQLYGMSNIDAPLAWDTLIGSREVVVAVVDTGIDRDHEDLAANTWQNTDETAGDGDDDDGNGFIDDRYGWDFADGDSDPDARTALVSDDDGGAGLASKIEWRCPAAGTYFFAVAGYNDARTGVYTVGVTGQDPSAGPVEYASHVVDDDADGGSAGDGNGVVDPGETIELVVELRNAGSLAAEGVEATLSAATAGVTLADDHEAFGDIAAGGSASCEEDFDVVVGAGVATGTQIVFDLAIADADGGSWSDQFSVSVGVDPYGEPDDTPEHAHLAPTDGTPIDRRLEVEGDRDWIKFQAARGRVYVIETSNLGDLGGPSAEGTPPAAKGDVGAQYADTVLRLYDTDGETPLETDDDGGAGLASRIEWTCPSDGVYFAMVTGYSSDSAGTYSVAATGTIAEPQNTISGGITGTGGEALEGVTVSAEGAAGSFEATTGADGAYTIADLPSGEYVVTPALARYTFTPAERIVTPPDDAVDFAAARIVSMVVDCDPTSSDWQSEVVAPRGAAFTVDIWATGVVNLDTWQFALTYDADRLSVGGVREGPFLTSRGGTTLFVPDVFTPGVVHADCSLTGTDRTQAPDNRGVIAHIDFVSDSDAGASDLHVSEATYWDIDGDATAPDAVDGRVVFTILGDFDRDGDVDVDDLREFRARWGAAAGGGAQSDLPYEARFDLDDDGAIGYEDFLAFWRGNPARDADWVPGDVTGEQAVAGSDAAGYPDAGPDDYLEITDLIPFADQFGTEDGDASWDPVFDFAGADGVAAADEAPYPVDGAVNFYDLTVFAGNWHGGSGPAAPLPGAGATEAPARDPGAIAIDLAPEAAGIASEATMLAGDELEVAVVARGLAATDTCELTVRFDPSALALVDGGARVGGFMESAGGSALSILGAGESGKLRLAASLIGSGSELTPAGDGELARLRLRVLPAAESATVEVTGARLYDESARERVATCAPATVSVGDLGAGDWRAEIRVAAGGEVAPANWFGVVADDDLRARLTHSASTVGGPIRAAFLTADGRTQGAYSADLAGEQGYRLAVTAVAPDTQVAITWPDLSAAPPDCALRLVDEASGETLLMRTSATYRYTTREPGETRVFRVEVFERPAGSPMVSGVAAWGAGGSAQISYALSADASVTVEVLNIAGRPVRRLLADRDRSAGGHTLVWDARSQSGALLPGGVYLVRITARSEDGRQSSAVGAMRLVRP